ncbi:MAG: hypothetical protein KA163_09820 [Bacteroidia bacterium]|nr:hypothetical protein [Bacteroidia bacterium]
MKKYFLALACFSLLSCEQIEKIDKQMDADSTEVAHDIEELKSLGTLERMTAEGESELLFKASGTEPGWIAEYYTDKFRLIVDYGKDSLIIRNISKYFDSSTGYSSFSYKNTEAGKETRLNVKIEEHECTDQAGVKNPYTITVSLNDKVYKGCGVSLK